MLDCLGDGGSRSSPGGRGSPWEEVVGTGSGKMGGDTALAGGSGGGGGEQEEGSGGGRGGGAVLCTGGGRGGRGGELGTSSVGL